MKHKLIIIFLMCTIPVLAVNNQSVKKIDVDKANKLISSNENNPDFVILDVRTPEEFSSGHLQNAVNIDYKSDNFKNELDKLDKQKTYVVHCRSGGRAAASVDIMKELGFENVYDMGGIVQWQEQGYDITKPENK
ncbi:MAG: rhodanese-like domain-containing protein [Thermodesulfobacteriota bacterium]